MRDAETSEQRSVHGHEVADGQQREAQPVGTARTGIDARRTGRAGAASEQVRAYDEEALGVQRAARTDDRVPPAPLPRVPMVTGSVGVTAQRMAHEHRVGAIGIERSVGLVCDLDRGEPGTGLQLSGRVSSNSSARCVCTRPMPRVVMP